MVEEIVVFHTRPTNLMVQITDLVFSTKEEEPSLTSVVLPDSVTYVKFSMLV